MNANPKHIILVTGASSGFGALSARALASASRGDRMTPVLP
ncbi:hypothetical protein [Xanthomonas tesorieronis]